jgi:hypothetical protein
MATGATHNFSSGTLQAAIAAAAPGDRVLVAPGNYPLQTITATPSEDVFIEGTGASFAGLTCNSCSHLYLRGLSFTAQVSLNTASFITFDGVTIDVGRGVDTTGLYLHGTGSATGMTHDVTVVRSNVRNGARTIFSATNFSPIPNWNHHLTFLGNDFVCGTHNCFQLSGGRDVLIEGNVFHDPLGVAVLCAGATRVDVLQNRMRGDAGLSAVQIASPGMEWDNYAGVEFMITSAVTVANNVMSAWGTGIEMDAAKDVNVVFNTVAGGVGFHTWHRIPHAQDGGVIIVGNSNMNVWNNILPSVQVDSADPMPLMIGNNLIGGNPMYVDTTSYQLAAGSPAIDVGVVTPDNPLVDLLGNVRGSKPDDGAIERGAVAPVCN